MAAATTTVDEFKTKIKTEKPKEEYKPPKPATPYVEVGMLVHWYPDKTRGEAPAAGFVSAVYHNRVALHVLTKGGGYSFKDGVAHIDEPNLVDADHEEGMWEHSKIGIALIDVAGAEWTYHEPTQTWK